MPRYIGVLIIYLFLFQLSFNALAKSSWDLTTDAKIESVYWPKSYGEDTNNTLHRLELIPTLSGKFSNSFSGYFRPSFLWDPQNKSKEEQVFFDIGQAYFKYKGETSSLQLGSNILNWGVTDGYNPLDVVNGRQYYDPLRSVKLGAWSLLFSHASTSSEQELIYIPRSRSSILPGTQSRWLPRQIYIPRSIENNVVLLLPENLNYTYESRETLNQALDNNVGLRLQWHFNSNLGAIDLGFTGFEGVATFPLIQPKVTGTVIQISPQLILQTDPDVFLRIKDYRQRVGGFSWVSSQFGFLLKYVTNYSQSLGDDPLLPGWTHENIFGLERNFNIGSEGLLVGILQYSFINTEKENASNLSVTEIFRRAWMAGGRFTWGDNWTFTALGLYDSLRYSHFQQYSLARRIADVWTLQLSAELISGREDTPLGVYNENDNYRLSLGRSF
ncbi:MAG TPA: hypothetical protein VIG33_08510 [Pseudobdellovibrionaceae bacterium]|jgi:hypothetical protein